MIRRPFAAALIAVSLAGAACMGPADAAKYKQLQAAQLQGAANIAAFDELDFSVFNGEKWDQLGKTHAPDVLVHWPDGHITKGIEIHINDLKGMFAYAPDIHIREHPVKVANGEWTAVTGILEGTFSRPMIIAGGRTIPPTNKPFRINMSTFGHWKNGVMDEEYLYWDNQTFLIQIGLLK